MQLSDTTRYTMYTLFKVKPLFFPREKKIVFFTAEQRNAALF